MDQHLIASLLTALIGGIVDLDSTSAVQIMVSQPIVASPLTGLCLGLLYGNPFSGIQLGLIIGSILQLVWIEKLPLGMNVPPDAALASVLSVAVGFIAGSNYTVLSDREACYTLALMFSVALGLLGRSLDMFVRRINTSIDSWVNNEIEDNNFGSIWLGHSLGFLVTFTKAFIFCFLITWFGVEPLKYFIKSLNPIQIKGFIVVKGVLPIVGYAVLANMCLKEQKEIKLFIGAALLFAVLPQSIGIAIATCVALFFVFNTDDGKKKKKKK